MLRKVPFSAVRQSLHFLRTVAPDKEIREGLVVERNAQQEGEKTLGLRSESAHLNGDQVKFGGWCYGQARGFATKAVRQQEASSYYNRAQELIRQVEEATEGSEEPPEQNDLLRSKLEQAAECLEISLSQGSDPHALLALSQLHERYDLQGRRPADRGLGLLYQAAEAGLAEAQYELACRLRLQENDDESGGQQSEKLLRHAAAQGHREAMFLLGAAEYDKQGEGANADLAKTWFKQAAELGHVPAACLYGVLLLKEASSGDSAKSVALKQEAQKYLAFAAEGGASLAAEWLQSIKT